MFIARYKGGRAVVLVLGASYLGVFKEKSVLQALKLYLPWVTNTLVSVLSVMVLLLLKYA